MRIDEVTLLGRSSSYSETIPRPVVRTFQNR